MYVYDVKDKSPELIEHVQDKLLQLLDHVQDKLPALTTCTR